MSQRVVLRHGDSPSSLTVRRKHRTTNLAGRSSNLCAPGRAASWEPQIRRSALEAVANWLLAHLKSAATRDAHPFRRPAQCALLLRITRDKRLSNAADRYRQGGDGRSRGLPVVARHGSRYCRAVGSGDETGLPARPLCPEFQLAAKRGADRPTSASRGAVAGATSDGLPPLW